MEFFDLLEVVVDSPLEDAAVQLAGGQEELSIGGEDAVGYGEEVVAVALVVALAVDVGVVEQADSA